MLIKIPVVIAVADIISGVVSWALEMREVFKHHERYKVLLLSIGKRSSDKFDMHVSSIDEALQLIKAMSPVIIIPNWFWDLCPVADNNGVRCLAFCHSDSAREYYNPLIWHEPFISRFIAVSKHCARTLAHLLPKRSHNIFELPYGIQFPESISRSYRNNPIRLVYSGRIVQHQKRVMDFVPMVDNLLQRNVDFIFDIVGDGADLKTLKRKISRIDTQGKVRFHGRIPSSEMPNIYLDHDVFLLISEFEGTSVSMLEAMSQGTVPVITSVNSGASDVVENHKNGLLVPIGNIDAMASAISDLGKKPELLKKMGGAAYESVKIYSFDIYSKKVTNIFDDMMSTH